ncbi:MAG: ATP-dependent DNA helicase RecG [Rhodospirillaceae bacterium]|jgi:ATP-dependent DNA helicase RecG|nr:ATP-dependent DNA helicase RecG [Rhodospirillaceae bacterium]MBT4042556.1 ATP-dependent DNA helicase RecG [Rhodospirillaceae bacterium]MBT5083673.1 ATP-dependent DNA helicase RecG [Rhodospirillaceae bacterium]MBT5522549.1 ATP-dependent DNA helicase RecG [Rhodospirillaceae bacterium]MBT6983842.1 ATP-dependent DNA helicase RecG [Rhodospirillaceae bacterium]
MRPEILFTLFKPATTLKGVGPRMGKLMEKLLGGPTGTPIGARLVDLCWHLPTGLIDRSFQPKVADAPDGVVATLTVTVDEHWPPANRRLPYKVICSDDSGSVSLVFFNAKDDYLHQILPIGSSRVVSGKIGRYGHEIQMAHPDHIVDPEKAADLPKVEATYPLTAGLTAKPMHKAVRAALALAPDLGEWQDPAWLAKQKWRPWRQALLAVHEPESLAALEPDDPARRRLAYDELLANQLALAMIRAASRKRSGRAIAGDGRLRDQLVATLPYTLTQGQRDVLDDIRGDMALPLRMLRLLQGDVGSGKTVVALLAMLAAVETGAQAAFMVPTEILARQHLATLTELCQDLDIRIAILTGRNKGRPRQALLDDLVDGRIDILIGTHALFTEDVMFKDLALIVIDEQHRFGVHQRLTLGDKGEAADILVMTATPIPRTLSLTVYGDMDISLLHGKPAGRKPVDTRAMALSRLDQVVAGVQRAINSGARAFWVCPLVEENEQLDLAAAEERHATLARIFGPENVGLIHGRMKAKEKDAAMAAFVAGETKVLVATTVIEVGVDVPEATIMAIEHAERFGLAQLHQLRGRVGRGDQQGHCLLLYTEPLGETARARIAIMRETEDGFRIAEEDLRLRGTGELLGTRQSGFPAFRIADPMAHQDLMEVARDDARLILDRDPQLENERGQALRALLYLFERDAAVKLLRSG